MTTLQISHDDRDMFETAVPVFTIQQAIDDLNCRLIYSGPDSSRLTPSVCSSRVSPPVQMAPDQSYRLPYREIDFQLAWQYNFPLGLKLQETLSGSRLIVAINYGYTSASMATLDFDEYLRLTHFEIKFSYTIANHGAARQDIMNVLYHELAGILGYIVTMNTRGRSYVTLGDIRDFAVHNDRSSPSVQNIGNVREITNPRDNPTGITKRPHERSGYYRRLPNGQTTFVSSTIVHRDEYEPTNEPKTLKR